MVEQSIPWKYKWSHQGGLHRAVVRSGNAILSKVPPELKYSVARQAKKSQLPYSLVEGKLALQVGAPYDTLSAGRSRAAHLGMAAGAGGALIVVEPFERSCEVFEKFAKQHLPCETVVINAGAWSSRGTIDLEVDEAHPATNFSSGSVEYSDERMANYRTVTVRSDTLDTLSAEASLGMPELVSITTNWAEREILAGTGALRQDGLKYVALALGENNEDYKEDMASYGYKLLGYEDRGATYQVEQA